MVYGKLIAGALGFLVAGPIGLLVGLFVGHSFDKGLAGNLALLKPEQAEALRQSFFSTTFKLMGHLAKADGRVSEAEVRQAEHVIAQMGLDPSQRSEAIGLFKHGANPEFDQQATLREFMELCGRYANLRQTILTYLISLALADGHMDTAERSVLVGIARQFGFSEAQFDHLLSMLTAQNRFHQHQSDGATQPGQLLAEAYAALGVTEHVSDRELKKAYRMLMSEHHPDKLIARGVPENMIKLATERSQDVQSAYERIKEHRKKTQRA